MTQYTDVFGHGDLSSGLDAETLLAECGIDEEEIEWRKEFIGFDDSDVERLESINPLFLEHQDQIADNFYANLTKYDETQSIFEKSEKTIEQLKQTQRAYLVTLTEGDYGREYFADRARIGKIHDTLEMPMKQYVGQYGVYYDLILPLLGERMKSRILDDLTSRDFMTNDESSDEEPEDAAVDPAKTLEETVGRHVQDGIEEILSVLRIINLDMQVVADTYIDSYNQDLKGALGAQERIMNQVEHDVQAPLTELQTASSGIADTAESISHRTDEQASHVTDINREVSNLSATVEEIASTATQVESRSKSAEDLAEQGEQSADDALDVMDDVGDAVDDVATDVDTLQERVDEIDEIVEVIDSIANQTNMLALNASIEAARAGEAGSGFAVVADEVKALAEESQEYANRIDQTIHEIQQDTEDTVQSLERTTEQVDSGVEQVQAAMHRLQDIVEAVKETSDGIEEVAAATDDQAASTEQVASMLDELVERTASVADDVEQIATSTDEQSAKIDEISKRVTQLQQ